MKLYGFAESGPCYKVALMLEMTGQSWHPRRVEPFSGETRSPEFLALNPMGEVPVLEADGRVFIQSGAMLDYLAAKSGQFSGPRADILPWILFDNEKLTGIIGPLRFSMNFMPEARRDPAVIAWLSRRMHLSLRTIETRLKGRDWLAGPVPTIADLSACGYLFHPEPYTFIREDYPAIDAWLGRISALPGWKHPYDLLPRFTRPEA